MAGKEDFRIFVGGLARNVSERQLESAFSRFGKVIETQIMLERDTGRPRGFGFITFSDRRGMDDAIREMHGQEFGDKVISVNKAQPRGGEDEVDHGYRGGGYSSGGRGSHGSGNRIAGQDECFKCGRPGHWARDCPSASGGQGRGRGRGKGGESYTSRSRFGDDGRGDRFEEHDRYFNDRFDGGRFGDRDRFDSRDNKYGSHDRYAGDRSYPYGGDRFASDRYGEFDQYPNGNAKDESYDREGGPRGGADRYGIRGAARDEGRSYRRSRAGPYDRPSRVGKPSQYERY